MWSLVDYYCCTSVHVCTYIFAWDRKTCNCSIRLKKWVTFLLISFKTVSSVENDKDDDCTFCFQISHSVFKLHILFSNFTFCFQTQTLKMIPELAEVIKYTKTLVPFYSISISLIKNMIFTHMTCTYKYNV